MDMRHVVLYREHIMGAVPVKALERFGGFLMMGSKLIFLTRHYYTSLMRLESLPAVCSDWALNS